MGVDEAHVVKRLRGDDIAVEFEFMPNLYWRGDPVRRRKSNNRGEFQVLLARRGEAAAVPDDSPFMGGQDPAP
eukprot:8938422-Pyramimonas_sp.AAC.1